MMGKLFAPKTSDPVVVIADDLSGAAELAGIAFASGYSAEVQREFDPTSDADVIAVDTDSRSLSEELSAQRVEQVTRAIAAAKPAWIYKKVDSVLRGNVRAETEAALRALGTTFAILIPANPSRGRTIVGGRLLIDGVPLDQTTFRNDPEHPRTTSAVSELLGQSDRIFAPDIGDAAVVAQVAKRTLAPTLPAGAADFFAALLDARGKGQGKKAPVHPPWHIDRPALLICGSPAAWKSRQAQCREARIPILPLLDPQEDLESGVRRAAAELAKRGLLVLAISGEMTRQRSIHELLLHLAAVTVGLLEITPVATILVEGGATAAIVAGHLAWNRLRVTHSAPAGIGVLKPIGADAVPTVLIKPGSYSWPAEIWGQFVQG